MIYQDIKEVKTELFLGKSFSVLLLVKVLLRSPLCLMLKTKWVLCLLQHICPDRSDICNCHCCSACFFSSSRPRHLLALCQGHGHYVVLICHCWYTASSHLSCLRKCVYYAFVILHHCVQEVWSQMVVRWQFHGNPKHGCMFNSWKRRPKTCL